VSAFDEHPNIGLELLRVTEAAAMAAAPWVGRGAKQAANASAIDAMHAFLQTVDIEAVIIRGEGASSDNPVLFDGERVGRGGPFAGDIALDAIDGIGPTASGRPNAISVVAMVEKGSMVDDLAVAYVNKLAVGPDGVGVVAITETPTRNLHALAHATGRTIRDLTAVVLDRQRHAELIAEIRSSGARLRLVADDDVGAAVSTALIGTGADILFGIGGSREAIISAAALRGLGGQQQVQLRPQDDAEHRAIQDAGRDLDAVLSISDLVGTGACYFAATGITDGDLLHGVRLDDDFIWTHSLVTQAQPTVVRHIRARHRRSPLSSSCPSG